MMINLLIETNLFSLFGVVPEKRARLPPNEITLKSDHTAEE
ncbi:hypothetical protein [Pedobacter sp.]|jgi:hypothetical protein